MGAIEVRGTIVSMLGQFESIIQLGSFGLLSVVIAGIGVLIWQIAKHLAPVAEVVTRFLAGIQETNAGIRETLAKMQSDNATHYVSDSFEQRNVEAAIADLRIQVAKEHDETRKRIDEVARIVGR